MPARALPVAAALLIVAGFLDVARGGITIGPLLLSAAYCVVIPAAILRGRLRAPLPGRQPRTGLRLSR